MAILQSLSLSPSRPTLLCIDLDANRRSALERCAGDDFAIVPVASGNAAIAALANHDVAVLVAGMHGRDVETVLRTVSERSPSTFRLVTSELDDIDRMLAWRDEGLVSTYVVSPWRDAELEQLLRWGCEAWTLANVAVAETRTTTLLHDLKSPLMTILANADHIHTLAAFAPALKELLAASALSSEERGPLEQLVDDLQPISEELTVAVRRITHMLDQARASGPVTRNPPRRTRAK